MRHGLRLWCQVQVAPYISVQWICKTQRVFMPQTQYTTSCRTGPLLCCLACTRHDSGNLFFTGPDFLTFFRYLMPMFSWTMERTLEINTPALPDIFSYPDSHKRTWTWTSFFRRTGSAALVAGIIVSGGLRQMWTRAAEFALRDWEKP
jgi:hypothetical protein